MKGGLEQRPSKRRDAVRSKKTRSSSKTTATTPLEATAWWRRAWLALNTDEWRVPLAIFFGSRLAILLFLFVFGGLVQPLLANKPATLLDMLTRWDGGWYAGIATHGYSWKGPETQSGVAFFPLYPLLARILSLVLFGNVRLALVIISNLAGLAYFCFLYRLVKRDFDASAAERSTLYVGICALSFFLSAGYTESLMLALVTGAFYFARKESWVPAIILGTLAPVCRSAGLAIVLPLMWEWRHQKGLTPRALLLLVLPVGLAVYMIYLWRLTGDPLAFVTVQQAWYHQFTWPWTTLKIAWDLVTPVPQAAYAAAIATVDFSFMIGMLVLLLISLRLLPPAYSLYSWPVFFLAMSATLTQGLPTASIGRYLMALFPAFVTLGVLGKNKYLHYAVLFCNAVLWGVLLLYFAAGIWVE